MNDAVTKLDEIQARLDDTTSDPKWLNEMLAELRTLMTAAPELEPGPDLTPEERDALHLRRLRDLATMSVARAFVPAGDVWLTGPDNVVLPEMMFAANRVRCYAHLLFPDPTPATAEQIAAVTAVAHS